MQATEKQVTMAAQLYDMSDIDSRCEGCPQVGLGKQYDQDIRSRGK